MIINNYTNIEPAKPSISSYGDLGPSSPKKRDPLAAGLSISTDLANFAKSNAISILNDSPTAYSPRKRLTRVSTYPLFPPTDLGRNAVESVKNAPSEQTAATLIVKAEKILSLLSSENFVEYQDTLQKLTNAMREFLIKRPSPLGIEQLSEEESSVSNDEKILLGHLYSIFQSENFVDYTQNLVNSPVLRQLPFKEETLNRYIDALALTSPRSAEEFQKIRSIIDSLKKALREVTLKRIESERRNSTATSMREQLSFLLKQEIQELEKKYEKGEFIPILFSDLPETVQKSYPEELERISYHEIESGFAKSTDEWKSILKRKKEEGFDDFYKEKLLKTKNDFMKEKATQMEFNNFCIEIRRSDFKKHLSSLDKPRFNTRYDLQTWIKQQEIEFNKAYQFDVDSLNNAFSEQLDQDFESYIQSLIQHRKFRETAESEFNASIEKNEEAKKEYASQRASNLLNQLQFSRIITRDGKELFFSSKKNADLSLMSDYQSFVTKRQNLDTETGRNEFIEWATSLFIQLKEKDRHIRGDTDEYSNLGIFGAKTNQIKKWKTTDQLRNFLKDELSFWNIGVGIFATLEEEIKRLEKTKIQKSDFVLESSEIEREPSFPFPHLIAIEPDLTGMEEDGELSETQEGI